MSAWQSVTRQFDLLMHRLRVGHGIPATILPITDKFFSAARDSFEQREQRHITAEAARVAERYAGRDIELVVTRWPGSSAPSRFVEVRGGSIEPGIKCIAHEPSAEAIRELASYLRDYTEKLRTVPIRHILEVLNEGSLLWLDENYDKRALAIEAIARKTGFSREMVIHSMDLEMRSSRGADMWRTLFTELGNPLVLDAAGMVPSGEAPAAAYGPELTAGIFSSNIPALPHLTYMRSAAVKSPVLGKVSTQEPIFAGLYIDTLIELDPIIGNGMAAVWFAGGTVDCERALFEQADHVIAYGGDRSLNALSKLLPTNTNKTFHGHRMGIGMVCLDDVTAEERRALARDIAYDVAVFDGQACLAPQVYFFETTDHTRALELTSMIGAELELMGQWLPRRRLSLRAAAARKQITDHWEVEAACDGDCDLLPAHIGDVPEWAALVTRGEYRPREVGDRLIHIHVVNNLDDVVPTMKPVARYLQNVAIFAPRQRRQKLAAAFSSLGASRITRPGLMPTPSMMWHHDGRSCLSDLVRWSDISV